MSKNSNHMQWFRRSMPRPLISYSYNSVTRLWTAASGNSWVTIHNLGLGFCRERMLDVFVPQIDFNWMKYDSGLSKHPSDLFLNWTGKLNISKCRSMNATRLVGQAVLTSAPLNMIKARLRCHLPRVSNQIPNEDLVVRVHVCTSIQTVSTNRSYLLADEQPAPEIPTRTSPRLLEDY